MSETNLQPLLPDLDVKACCSLLYESEWARLLLGETFHPGGLELTDRIGQLLELDGSSHVLDVACGHGAPAIHLAMASGCDLTGIDLSAKNIRLAQEASSAIGAGDRVRFLQADAEALPFDSNRFDAVICECALCTFPNKPRAIREIVRVLKWGGRFGMSDVVREGALPEQLDHVLAMAACIADAKSVKDYCTLLSAAGLDAELVERHDSALRTIANQIHTRLIGAQLLIRTGAINLPEFDTTQTRTLLGEARRAIAGGRLGYGIILASKGRSASHLDAVKTPS